MKKLKNSKIWITVFVLFMLVLISFALVFNMLLLPSSNASADKMICVTANAPTFEQASELSDILVSAAESSVLSEAESGEIRESQSSESASPDDSGGLVVWDDKTVWENNTEINIFEHNDPHVQTDGTGKAAHVIAPGTSNDYIFALQNDKSYGIKYTLNIEGGNNGDFEIPVRVKILDTDGNSLTGEDWISIEDLKTVTDTGRLNPYTDKQYIVRWKWDFENGTDDYDTFLGNQAVEEEIACHININVISEYDYNPSDVSEPSDSVVTGDNNMIWIYVVLSAFSAVLLLMIIFVSKRKNNQTKGR